ncbi:hypothetical protein SUGI_0073010 [Cryptomeria japonica]|nr:hypothetical protein SUGI_0073010 [Cryptomeria japonica]
MDGLQKPHVAVFSFPTLGHYIPMLELSRLVASQHLIVSYVTTPGNVPGLQDFVDEDVNCGIDLRLTFFSIPTMEILPDGRESADVCPSEPPGIVLFVLSSKEGEDCVVLRLDLPRPLRFKRNEINKDYSSVDEMNLITKFVLPMLQIFGKGGSGLILSRSWSLHM